MTVINRKDREKMEGLWEVKCDFAYEENKHVINGFLLSLKNQNRSKSTLIRYRRVLEFFFKNKEVSFISISSDDIQSWKMVHQKELKEVTIQTHIFVLRSFYKFCKDNGCIGESPFLEDNAYEWELKELLPNKENQKVINEFLGSLKNEDRSKRILSNARSSLQLFFRNKPNSFSTVTSEETTLWFRAHQKERKKSTADCQLSHLRAFYNFCLEAGYVDKNPFLYHWEKENKYWEVDIILANNINKERINEYLLSIYVLNYSKDTINGYRYNLQVFFKGKKELFSTITSDEILQWLSHAQKKYKEKTITNYLITLNSFFSFCVEEGYIDKSPMKMRWYPRLPKPIPKYLNKEEVAKIRNHCEKENLRNRVLVEFLLTSGCRIGEVHQLNRTDVDLENRTAIVFGKGKKFRQVHFSVKCCLLLEQYLDLRKDKELALFVTSVGKPRRLSKDWLKKIINKVGKVSGISGTLHPHRLRHTFATDLLSKGADLSFIGEELGHKQLKTTQIYASLPEQKIVALYRKYMG
ncbi:tyrosine-type recombinase/integrase [Robertmurraya andreesenii]|uniref:Site-specific recombinase XerD n=1 Tax=Anoxybacillus andreesenii TaxID=1325932 RepID=A0ABT9V019_9BACL|nr:tyrosine-type recombinase/integrase [Robertmurraya andreesenii]MDQ0154247.1 site-specific recombinase XerD [Robertmurraya andreesenii]